MNSLQDASAIPNCRGSAQLNTTGAAIILGFQEHDIPALVSAHLLVPLGKPAANAPKNFAAVDVVACAESRDWLSQATRTISKFWAQNHVQKKLKSVSPNPVAA